MQLGALFDQSRGHCVVRKVWKAANTWERMRGLLGRTRLEIGEALLNRGIEAVVSTPEEFTAYIKSETAKWNRVIRAANLKPN